ncbi:dystrophin [Elysia marginata]|uniref:Dystrophin n=1 Tax=Elysia marginata TaxID=1093978 RepID=A0AAV4IWH1_9GAST|nr:dystrophin [Elysia marginata]
MEMEELFKTCFDEAFQGWEQKINETGVIYYVKFSVENLTETFPSAGNETETQYMTYEQALELIEKTLLLSQQGDIDREGVPRLADLIVNLIANLCDRSHSGKLVPRCVQTFLIALCGSTLSEKYKFLCKQIRQQDGKIPREQITYLIADLMQIPYLLKDSLAFGIDVGAAVDSCLNNCKESESVSPEDLFSWLCREPQTLVWLPTLHRITATEKVQHAVRCSVCRVQPITGFRYKCLFCIGYNLCQNCFLQGRVSLSHKLGHPVREYCFPATSTDCTKAWLHIVKNKLLRRQRAGAAVSPYLAVEAAHNPEAVVLNWEPRSIEVDQTVSLYHFSDSGQGSCPSAEQSNEPAQSGSAGGAGLNPPVPLGQPFDSSSPVYANTDSFSKFNKETQYKMMALKIEELQQENRVLRKKLNEYQLKCQSEPEQAELAVGSTISPINNCSKVGVGESSEDQNCGTHDTLAIVGAITPVRTMQTPAIVVEPYPTRSSHGVVTECDVTESTRADGLQYRSSDMSLLSNSGNMTDQSGSKANLSALTNSDGKLTEAEETYKPSDMSLLCAGLANAKLKNIDRSCEEKDAGIVSSLTEAGASGYNSTPAVDSLENKLKSRLVFDTGFSESHDAGASTSPSFHQNSPSQSAEPSNEIDLSKIHPESFSATPEFLTHNYRDRLCLLATPENGVSSLRRMTLEPRHQSTPVTACAFSKRAKSVEYIGHSREDGGPLQQQGKLEHSRAIDGKENFSPKKRLSSTHSSSCSAKDKSSKKLRVLTESDVSNREMRRQKNPQSPVKTTETLRDSKAMLTQDGDELNQIMADFERQCKISDYTQSDGTTRVMTINDSSVMAAAFNIGDVLAEFVQAVAKSEPEGNVSLTTEMTHF